jgi:hypothetical protein
MRTLAAAAALMLLQTGPGEQRRVVERGDQSNIDAPRQVAARTAAEWTALWRQHAPDRPQPAVDLQKEMVVGLFLGSRPTAGFGIDLVETRDEQGTLVVVYRETTPPRDALTAQMLTFPYILVALPRHAGAVRFERGRS